MTLIFNLPGAIQEVQTSRTNKEKIEALNRFTEEFYKTIGILFYTRYLNICIESNEPLDENVQVLIRDYLATPTFDSWMRLGKLCSENLRLMGDRLALEFNEISVQELESSEAVNAKKILKEIHRLRSSHNYRPPRKITLAQVIEVMRLLRNFRTHEWDNNSTYEPLLKLNIDEFIINLVEKLMSNIKISTIKPISIQEDGIEIAELCGINRKNINIPYTSNFSPDLSRNYIVYYEDEEKFRFKTTLLRYHENYNKCYIFLKYLERRDDAIYEVVPVIGEIEKIGVKFNSIDEIFGLPKGSLKDAGLEQTLEQKFGKICINNEIIHNIPEELEDYIKRGGVEKKLLEKLNHLRLYLTTLDGGGGFGKTELAKHVVWSLINSETKQDIPKSLQFKYVVWVTGKEEYFHDGTIDKSTHSFKSVEDLLDSILYVTGNSIYITKTFDEKKLLVISILNQSPSTLLLLDNLETVTEKELVWEFLIDLGNQIRTDLKVLVTSRTRGGSAEQRLNVRKMEPEEAISLAKNEMKRLDVPEEYQSEDNLKILIDATGSVPLLIRHSINLISKGHNLNEICNGLPLDSDQALNFICDNQWNELSKDAQKLLMGIAYQGGKLSFAQAKLLCSFSEKQFLDAREQLQDNSFLVDQTLMNSLLTILPPIGKYSERQLKFYPDIEEEFIETYKLLEISSGELLSEVSEFTDEIALNQIFQRAELLIKRGAINEALQWYKIATDRFPENHIAWRSRGEVEYKYFGNEQNAEESFSKAASLSPRDPVTYENWAYWEFDIGSRNSRKLNIKRSIKFNDKAKKYSENDEDIRRINNHIASAYMKLGYITRDEFYRTNHRDRRRRNEITKEKDIYFQAAIKILQNNLLENPVTYQETNHNIRDYSMLATAYLTIGNNSDPNRENFDIHALFYLIQGLKINPDESQLLFTLGHPGLHSTYKKFKINKFNVNAAFIRELLKIETKVKDSINI